MLKNTIKKIIKKAGFEVRRHSIHTSESARVKKLFDYHQIDLVLDVGANIGQYRKFLRELDYTGRIVSFEPLSSAYSRLQKLSRKDPLWEVAPQTAIGNEEGEITINISNNSFSSSILPMLDSHLMAAPQSAYCGAEVISITKLDTIAKKYITSNTKSIFIKVDVQGYEKQVIAGAVQLLPLVKGFEVELSFVRLYKDQPLWKEMITFLEKLGYEPHLFLPEFTDINTGRLLQMNGFFFSSSSQIV